MKRKQPQLITSKSFSATLNWASSDGWIKANVDQIGYYRVNYETENWKSLYLQLQSDHKVRTNIHPTGRFMENSC